MKMNSSVSIEDSNLSDVQLLKLQNLVDMIEPLYTHAFINEIYSKKRLKKKLVSDTKFLELVKERADVINSEIKNFELEFSNKIKTIRKEILRCNKVLKYLNESSASNMINEYEPVELSSDLLVYSEPVYQDICKIFEKIELESIYKKYLHDMKTGHKNEKKRREYKRLFTKTRFQLNKYYSNYNKVLSSYKGSKRNKFANDIKKLEEVYIKNQLPVEYKKLCESQFKRNYFLNFHIKYWVNIGKKQYSSFDDYILSLYERYHLVIN